MRLISVALNAIQAIDNEMARADLIIYCLNCLRRDWNVTYKTGLTENHERNSVKLNQY